MEQPLNLDLTEVFAMQRTELPIRFQPLATAQWHTLTLTEVAAHPPVIRIVFDEARLGPWRERLALEHRGRAFRDAYRLLPDGANEEALVQLGLTVLTETPFE